MPNYDFVCNECGTRFEAFFTYAEYGKRPAPCPRCGSENTRRRMNKVRIAKSEESRMESAAERFANLEGLEDDPKALGKMMREMGKEMGEDLPKEFDEVTERLEAGQSPEEIESALPDLGADDSEA